jgi:hypothetical protein
MKSILITISIIFNFLYAHMLYAQKFNFEKGSVQFSVITPVGDMQAVDSHITGYIDVRSGVMSFKVLIDSFLFIKPFNTPEVNNKVFHRFISRYMDTKNYPYALFEGKLTPNLRSNLSKNGTYKSKITGVATIHGTSQTIELECIFIVKDNSLVLKTSYPVRLVDYNIIKPDTNIEGIEVAHVVIDCLLRL